MMVTRLLNEKGKPVANHNVIWINRRVILQSYDSLVCEVNDETKEVKLGFNHDYSNTTRKNVSLFLRIFGINPALIKVNQKPEEITL